MALLSVEKNTHRSCLASMGFASTLMPRTRYQGSKYRTAPLIRDLIVGLDYESVLDAFGGSGSIAYVLKALNKVVTYNDLLSFNYWVGKALIENQCRTLSESEVSDLLINKHRRRYAKFITDTFEGVYFTTDENCWLDTVAQNLADRRDPYQRAIGYYALFQAALAKRPYNLFHRRNLYMRTAKVPRGFGNKTSWDRPFDVHFRRFVNEANAAVFDNGLPCRALCQDAVTVEGRFDLVYCDPPYLNRRGVGVDYHHFYHFLEGLVDYSHWKSRIDWSSKHRRLRSVPSVWTDPKLNHAAFAALFERFADSILVVSYRSDGIPSIEALRELLGRFKRHVSVITLSSRAYVLSTNRRSREMLLIGTDRPYRPPFQPYKMPAEC